MFRQELITAVGLTTFLLVVTEVGYRSGQGSTKARDQARQTHVRAISSAMLGLLSLLLGFSFSMAVERYTVRRDLVVKEANAIGATWLRAGLLPEPHRGKVKRLLERFADIRLRTYADADDSVRVAEGLRLCAEVEWQLWHHAEEAAQEVPGVIAVAFITTLNQVIDTDAERIAAARNQVPAGVWVVLIVVAGVGCYTAAYAVGRDYPRSRLTSVLLPLIVSLVILLIFDLTHERRGIIGISQQPLIDLHGLFRTEPL